MCGEPAFGRAEDVKLKKYIIFGAAAGGIALAVLSLPLTIWLLVSPRGPTFYDWVLFATGVTATGVIGVSGGGLLGFLFGSLLGPRDG